MLVQRLRFPFRLFRPAARLILAAMLGLTAPAEWPQFRGPSGQGRSSASGLPLRWSESQNITWKAAIPGEGWSSPVISDGQIWLTAATEGGASLRAIALDQQTGRILHNVEVFRLSGPPRIHEKNSYASPTPILEPGRVYVHFGTLGTAALNRSGEVIWRNQQLRYAHGHGGGGSPELAGDRLVISCDGTDQQYVVALDKGTGEILWKTARRGGAMAYTTPLAIPRGGGRQIVSPGANQAVSYDLASGRELWSVDYEGFSGVPRPVFAHGMVYVTSGFYDPVLMAIRPDGSGDVTKTHVTWQARRGVPLTPSPLVEGGELYMVSDNGIASCLDAKTGAEIWRQRLGGGFSASPVSAEGRIYFLNESGEATVVRAGRSFERLANNQLEGRTLASPAIEGRAIYLRTDSHLYRIEEQLRSSGGP
jgi:outer membrane protein assembly factor BamB